MTEEYKKKLIDYATGNITTGTPTTEEIIKEQIEVNRDKWINYIPSSWEDFHFESILKDNRSNKYILYGSYRERGSTSFSDKAKGIIILLDEELNPYKTFYEFDSGTQLRPILLMNQAPDGTFYMCDDICYSDGYTTTWDSTPRFVMLNNFVAEEKVTLRTSYIFPYKQESTGYWFSFYKLEKNPNSAQYVMFVRYQWYNKTGGQGGTGLWDLDGVASIELNIPYGESPAWTWNEIAKGKLSELSDGYYRAGYIQFNEDKYMAKVICNSQIGSNNDVYLRYYFKDYSSNSYTYTNILDISSERLLRNTIYRLEQQEVFINENECYFIESNLQENTNRAGIIYLYKYDVSTNTLTTIYENHYPAPETTSYNRSEAIFLAQNQGKLYIEYLLKKDTQIYDYYYQRYEGTWQPVLVAEDKPCQTQYRAFYVNNNFNLLKIFLYPNNPRSATWYFKILKEVYNPTQYNGESYVSVDSLSPLYSNLYSNGSLIFSRNLYNISKQNNMTMSSVEIPNTYLNNINITQNDLISETNKELVNDSKQWNKNIYEIVDLNFLNTISVIDEDTNTPYLESAIKLNNATTDGGSTNYQNTPCNKYRVNYEDNTNEIGTITWQNITDLAKQTNFTIYVEKAIKNIDLISNDESTIYLTINENFEIDNYYTINQKVRIGDKPQQENLIYNAENVLYNGEQVKVYTI